MDNQNALGMKIGIGLVTSRIGARNAFRFYRPYRAENEETAWMCVLPQCPQPSGEGGAGVPPTQGCADQTRSQTRPPAHASPVSTYRQIS